MDTSVVDSKTVELLSQITGQPLQPQDVTPLQVFLAVLVSVLRGVIVIDKNIAIEEEQRFQKTLGSIIRSNQQVQELTQLILTGVETHQTYLNPGNLITLSSPLSDAEKLLILCFGYQMSAADNDIDFREQMYLQSTANRLGILPRHWSVINYQFTGQGVLEQDAWQEVQVLLDPVWFESLVPVFTEITRTMLSDIATRFRQ